MAESPAQPTPSQAPVPNGTASAHEEKKDKKEEQQPPTDFPRPKLRLEIRDLHHGGATQFLGAVNAATVLSAAVDNVLRLLYRTAADPTTHAPPTRSVTVVLRDMGGVAYTTGSELDDDHKEIHFSLPYIAGIQPASRAAHEITGVLTHELVHCYQWNARGSCPGGLIEGVADWVRLRCGLAPPHWRRDPAGGAWDRGYDHTAYFLAYLEGRFGEGTVRRLNEKLRVERYEQKRFWTELLGRPVEQLYEDYCAEIAKQGGTSRKEENGGTVDEGTQT